MIEWGHWTQQWVWDSVGWQRPLPLHWASQLGGVMFLRVAHQDRSIKPKATVIVNKEVQEQKVGGVSDMHNRLNSCMQCWQLV